MKKGDWRAKSANLFCPSRGHWVHWKVCAHHAQDPDKDCWGCTLWWGKKEANNA